jgi:molybdate transport system regulatory protein
MGQNFPTQPTSEQSGRISNISKLGNADDTPIFALFNPKPMEKFSNVNPEYKVWFSTLEGKGILGDGKWKILKKIEECGSLVQACEELNITYRRTWNDLKKIEQQLGFKLLETTRGGAEGGSTHLTEEGIHLIKAFDHFHQRMDKIMKHEFEKFLVELKS